ncbi:MAG: gliding motility-associated C-terminal domain-containing protein [Saprospiraceae bacterium]
MRHAHLLLLAFCWPALVAGQQISFSNPAGLTVCDTAFTDIQVANDSTAALDNALLYVKLSNCLEYLPGSISGAQEVDIADLQHPVFSLASIPPGETASIQLELWAPCACFGVINAGSVFSNSLQLLAWGDTLALTTPAFTVETAQLVITQVGNAFLTGSTGDSFTRTFTVLNTRPGALSAFFFEDFYQEGIQLGASPGIIEIGQPGHLGLRLSGADFQGIGDGDALFEQGETITITETVLITSCDFGAPSSLSQVLVSWGCAGQSCQPVQQTALVKFQPSNLGAGLSINALAQAPACFCAYEAVPQSLTIVNQGTEPAFDPVFFIRQDQDDTGIDPASVTGSINGIPTPLNVTGANSVLFELPCAEDGPFVEKIEIKTPDLQVGDTLTLNWNTYFCSPSCSQSENRWIYEYRYGKSCPPGALIQSDTFQAVVEHPELTATLTGDFQLGDGETQTYDYTLQYDSLHLMDGQLQVLIEVPCGLQWEDNDMILSGAPPASLIVQPIADSAQLVAAFYQLPLPGPAASLSFDLTLLCDSLCQQEFICLDSLLTSCPQPSCAEAPAPRLFLEIKSTLLNCPGQPAFCGVQACETYGLEIACEPDSICLDTIAGYLYPEVSFRRLNLGLPDNDDNRWPDGPDFLNPGLLRPDRSMPGDTVETVLAGLVYADQPNAAFPFALAEISFQPLGADPVINAGLYDPEGIKAIDAALEIWDASTGAQYSCPDLSFWAETTTDRLIYRYNIRPDSLAAGGCAIPAGFAWEQGDSIRLTARHKLNYNPVKQSSTAPSPPIFQVTVRPSLSLGQTADELDNDPFTCGCPSATWEVTGYEYQLLPGVYAIPFCDTSQFQGSTFYKLELGKGNFFPYEYRPLGSAPRLTLGLPPGIHLAGSQVKQFTLQEGPSWKGVTPIQGQPENGNWTFDLSPCQDTLADEGFFFLFQYRFTADCTLEGAYPMQLAVLTEFAPGIFAPSDTVSVFAEDNALKILLPTLQLFNPLPNQLALGNKGQWNFQLTNLPNSISGQQSGVAPNVWIAPVSGSGLLGDFALLNTQTGQPVPHVNGIFQLDSLAPGASLQLSLEALNASCQQETLEIHYGFDCEPYQNLSGSPCQIYTQYWTVLAPPGGVDIALSGPDSCAMLCDTIPYHTVTVYNTNLGPVCDPWIEITLPEGLYLTTASAEIAYPPGSGFAPVADPVFLGNGTYRWDLAAISPDLAENCLPGVGAAPQHQVALRFLTETDCSFAINSSILFRAGGERNCGEPVNIVARPGNPVCIELEGDDIQTFFQAGLEEEITCQDTGLFNLALVHSALSQLTDTLSLLLPPGVSYVPGSLIPVANAPGNEPLADSLNGRIRLNWALNPGLNPFTLIAFRISLAGFAGLPCGEDYFLVTAGIQSEAVCVATGDTCSVRVETGAEYLPFNIQRPVLSIASFEAHWKPDTLFGSIVVTNTTTIAAEQVVIDIYLDQDGDGLGDSLLLSPLIPFLSGADTVVFPLPLSIDETCRVLAVIDSTTQCLCGFETHPIDQPIRYFQTIDTTGCAQTPYDLGLCLPGWAAQWAPAGLLSCDTCCIASFSAPNISDSTIYFTAVQYLENGNGCGLEVPYRIGVRPEPGIAYADPVACAGEGVNLIAEAGLSFLWEGPGMQPVPQQALTIIPEESDTYVLTMTDLNGCLGVDSIEISVFPLPVADAGADTVFCPGSVFQLQAQQSPFNQYAWSPGAVFDDPGSATPVFTTLQEGSYMLEVTGPNGCKALDTVQVGFGETPTVQLPGDTLVCLGDSLIIHAQGDFTSLSWALPCLNPPLCDSVLLVAGASVEVSVVATNADQCIAEATIWVEVADESSYQTDTVFTCANEPVWVAGQWTATPGFYCDTLVLPSGCRQVFCTELMVGDTSFQLVESVICPGDSLFIGGQWFAEAGVYALSLSTQEGCDSTLNLNLAWFPLPEVALLPADTTIFEEETVTLSVTGGGNLFYYWIPPNLVDCNSCPTVLAAPLETTGFQVWVTDENGCVQSLSSTVQVRVDCDPGRVQIPNVFTPDGDGVNESFGILTVAGKETVSEMQVWNRWGQLVFESRNPQARWDGRFRDQPSPSDEYVYRIVVVCPDGLSKVYAGSVTLIR